MLFFNFFLHILLFHDVEASENIKFQLSGVYRTLKVGCFFKMVKILHFCYFITKLVKKLRQGSLYEVMENILPFVLNTKRPLSDIWLLSYVNMFVPPLNV